jgi:hypothetical protein
MSKQLLLTLGRGLAMLAAVYVPTFAVMSAVVISGASLEAAIPVMIGVSLGIALLLMATVGGKRFQSFGFRPAGARMLWWSLCLGVAVAFAFVHLALPTVGASSEATAFVVASALVLGLAAGQLRWSTGSLVPCFVIHALFNIIIG